MLRSNIANTVFSNSVRFFAADEKHERLLEALGDYFDATLGDWSEKRTAIKHENTVRVVIEAIVKSERMFSLTSATEESYHLTVAESESTDSHVCPRVSNQKMSHKVGDIPSPCTEFAKCSAAVVSDENSSGLFHSCIILVMVHKIGEFPTG